jgi:hypothetical protein
MKIHRSLVLVVLFAIAVSFTCLAVSIAATSDKQQEVKGYTTKSGKVVKGYTRKAPSAETSARTESAREKVKPAREKAAPSEKGQEVKGYTTKSGKAVKGYTRKVPSGANEEVKKPSRASTRTPEMRKPARSGAGPGEMVHVRGYCKKNGTCVKAYERRYPTKNK